MPGDARPVAGELAAVVEGIVGEVALHPVATEPAVDPTAQDVSPLSRPRLAGRRPVCASCHLRLGLVNSSGLMIGLVRLLRSTRPSPSRSFHRIRDRWPCATSSTSTRISSRRWRFQTWRPV